MVRMLVSLCSLYSLLRSASSEDVCATGGASCSEHLEQREIEVAKTQMLQMEQIRNSRNVGSASTPGSKTLSAVVNEVVADPLEVFLQSRFANATNTPYLKRASTEQPKMKISYVQTHSTVPKGTTSTCVPPLLERLDNLADVTAPDQEFPPTPESLGEFSGDSAAETDTSVAADQWQPVTALGATSLFQSIDYTDVDQGLLGTCYFLAAIAAFAYKCPELLERNLATNTHPGSSVPEVTEVRWFLNGKPVMVQVSNLVPVASGHGAEPLFAKASSGEAWPALMEKSWAKAFGTYAAAESGGTEEVMRAISFAPVTVLMHTTYADNPQALFEEIELRLSLGCPITAGTLESSKSVGLPSPHAYVVLEAINDLSGVGMVMKLYNPWNSQGTQYGHTFNISMNEFVTYFGSTVVSEVKRDTVNNIYVPSLASLSYSHPPAPLVVSWTMPDDGPFDVIFSWPSPRLLSPCPILDPAAVFVISDDTFSSVHYASRVATLDVDTWKTLSMVPQWRKSMPGKAGTYVAVLLVNNFPTYFEEVSVSVYAGTSVQVYEDTDRDALSTFLQITAPAMVDNVFFSYPALGVFRKSTDPSMLINGLPVFLPEATNSASISQSVWYYCVRQTNFAGLPAGWLLGPSSSHSAYQQYTTEGCAEITGYDFSSLQPGCSDIRSASQEADCEYGRLQGWCSDSAFVNECAATCCGSPGSCAALLGTVDDCPCEDEDEPIDGWTCTTLAQYCTHPDYTLMISAMCPVTCESCPSSANLPPTPLPTTSPTANPTANPTAEPTTAEPTDAMSPPTPSPPTPEPTSTPTVKPTPEPTTAPVTMLSETCMSEYHHPAYECVVDTRSCSSSDLPLIFIIPSSDSTDNTQWTLTISSSNLLLGVVSDGSKTVSICDYFHDAYLTD